MNITYQLEMMPPLPTIFGPVDYRDFRENLEHIDRILVTKDLEMQFIADDLEHCGIFSPTPKDIEKRQHMLRCAILKAITGVDFRELSMRIADSPLFQWFAGYSRLSSITTPSKSTLQRYCQVFESWQVQRLIDQCIQVVQQPEIAQQLLYRDAEISVSKLFADSTCIKASIHFPVDWVLLRDGVRTLINAIILIRKEGLLHRMTEPKKFLSEMNSLCIEMSQARRKTNAAKMRKKILRKMKKLSKLVLTHGQRYYDLLEARWEYTRWSRAETDCILKRIDNILVKLPLAIKQAHERIIGERPVTSKEKLLSLYEEDVHVITRGKANAEVEFGNGLYLVEQENGLIVDWELFEEYPKHDSHCVQDSIEKIKEKFGTIESYTADRGFDTRDNTKFLDKENITNGICPKDPGTLKKKLENLQFVKLQKRRAQTEGRIAILKNAFTGNPLNCRGFENRKKAVAWCVLAHNLWLLGSMARKARKKLLESQSSSVAA